MKQQPSAALKREWMLLGIMAAVLAVAAIIAAGVFFGGRYVKVQRELDLGRKYLDELDYEQAVIHFTSAIEIDDRSVPAYLGRGEANLGLEEYELAEADYTMVIETLETESVDAYVGRAEAYSGQGKTEEAEEDLQRAQELGLTEEEAETIREEVLPTGPLTADQVTWVVEPSYDYQQVLPLRSRSFSDVEGPYSDGTVPVAGSFYEMSFPGYSNLPQYYNVQLADGSWRLYYMPDHVDSGDIPWSGESEIFDADGILNFDYSEDFRAEEYPYPWHLFTSTQGGRGTGRVYYDTFTQQGILEGDFYSVSLQSIAQAGLHKPYPAGSICTENCGLDANENVQKWWGEDFDFDRYEEAMDSQRQDYPKCYIGTDGQPITDFLYDGAEDFSEGLAACSIDGKWGYIDENGNPVTEFIYDGVWPKNETDLVNYESRMREAGYPCTSDTMVVWKDGQVGLLYRDGSVLIDFGQFEDMAPAFNNELWAKQDGLWGLIDLADAKQKMKLDPELSVPAKTEAPDPEWKPDIWEEYLDTDDILPDYPKTISEASIFLNGQEDSCFIQEEMITYTGPGDSYPAGQTIPEHEFVEIMGEQSGTPGWVYVCWGRLITEGMEPGYLGGWVEKSAVMP